MPNLYAHEGDAPPLEADCAYCTAPMYIFTNVIRRARPRFPVTQDCPACFRPNVLNISADGRRVTLVVADLLELAHQLKADSKSH